MTHAHPAGHTCPACTANLPLAPQWFAFERFSADLTLISEPHVIPLMRCNIWHLRGRDRDLLIDSGMGIVSLHQAAAHLFDKPLSALATHAHLDHIGSFHEFADRLAHRLDAEQLARPTGRYSLISAEDGLAPLLGDSGYDIPALYITAKPTADFDLAAYRLAPAAPTRLLDEGDIIDLGDRHLEVLHLPGHAPGSIGLYEAASGMLFSGDAVYDGPLLDSLPESDIPAYCRTMERLLTLDITVVHGGHDPSFGRARLHEIARSYLTRHGG